MLLTVCWSAGEHGVCVCVCVWVFSFVFSALPPCVEAREVANYELLITIGHRGLIVWRPQRDHPAATGTLVDGACFYGAKCERKIACPDLATTAQPGVGGGEGGSEPPAAAAACRRFIPTGRGSVSASDVCGVGAAGPVRDACAVVPTDKRAIEAFVLAQKERIGLDVADDKAPKAQAQADARKVGGQPAVIGGDSDGEQAGTGAEGEGGADADADKDKAKAQAGAAAGAGGDEGEGSAAAASAEGGGGDDDSGSLIAGIIVTILVRGPKHQRPPGAGHTSLDCSPAAWCLSFSACCLGPAWSPLPGGAKSPCCSATCARVHPAHRSPPPTPTLCPMAPLAGVVRWWWDAGGWCHRGGGAASAQAQAGSRGQSARQRRHCRQQLHPAAPAAQGESRTHARTHTHPRATPPAFARRRRKKGTLPSLPPLSLVLRCLPILRSCCALTWCCQASLVNSTYATPTTSEVRVAGRSILPRWGSVQFRLVLRTYAPWGESYVW